MAWPGLISRLRIVFVGRFVSRDRFGSGTGGARMRGYRRGVLAAIVLMACGMVWAQGPKAITVGAAGADFATIQAAVNAAPAEGAVIRIWPGVYREVVHVDKPKIQLRGDGDWRKVVLVYGNSAASTCGPSC